MPRFLSDEPFSNNNGYFSHENIANQIYKIVNDEKNSSIKRKVIALFGGWGSGKSTVIKMLDNKTKKDNKIQLIEFNTWANTDEFLRRNFLYKMLSFLKLENKENDEGIKYHDLITGKVVKRTIDQNPMPTWKKAIIYLTLILIFVFFMNINFVSNFIKESFFIPNEIEITQFKTYLNDLTNDIEDKKLLQKIYSQDTTKDSYKLYKPYITNETKTKLSSIFIGLKKDWFSIIISFILNYFFLLLFIFFIIIIIKILFFKKKDKNGSIITKIIENFLRPFLPFIGMTDITMSESTTAIEKGDLSIYDFKEIFNKLVDGQKLIIVLDNLDRVDDETVINMLNNLEVFIEEPLINIWFIVPIDEDKLKKIVSAKYNCFEDEECKNKQNNTYSISNHFIEKIFTIKFFIAGIFNKEWRKYFEDKFKEAFCEKDEQKLFDELTEIINIFQKGRGRDCINLTPREIINFINEMVTLYITNNKIDIKSIALYAIYKCYYPNLNFFESLESLKDKNDNNDGYKYLLNYEPEDCIEKNLLTIFYQTDNPYEILYYEKLSDLIEKGETKKIVGIQNEIGLDNFSILFVNILIDKINEANNIQISGSLYSWLKNFIEHINTKEKDRLTKKTIFRINKDNFNWSNLDEQSSLGYIFFYNEFVNEKDKPTLLDITKNNFKNVNDINRDFIIGYYHILENIQDEIKLDIIESNILEVFTNFFIICQKNKLVTDKFLNIYKEEIKSLISSYRKKFCNYQAFSTFTKVDFDIISTILDMKNNEYFDIFSNNLESINNTFKNFINYEFSEIIEQNNSILYFLCKLLIYRKLIDNNIKINYDYLLGIIEVIFYLNLHLDITENKNLFMTFLAINNKSIVDNTIDFYFALDIYLKTYNKYSNTNYSLYINNMEKHLEINTNSLNNYLKNIIQKVEIIQFIDNIEKYSKLNDILRNLFNNNINDSFNSLIDKISTFLIDSIFDGTNLEYVDKIIKDIIPLFWDEIQDKDNIILNYIIKNHLEEILNNITAIEDYNQKILYDIKIPNWNQKIKDLIENRLKSKTKDDWGNIFDNNEEIKLITLFIDNTKTKLDLSYDSFGILLFDKIRQNIDKEETNEFLEFVIKNIANFLEYPKSLKDSIDNTIFNLILENSNINYSFIELLIKNDLITDKQRLFITLRDKIYKYYSNNKQIDDNLKNMIELIDKNIDKTKNDEEFVRFLRKIKDSNANEEFKNSIDDMLKKFK
ncbi:MAG: hypothetical protein A2Y34_16475 [Spirochaetes bacterium GWC1_27_15]|nr:MAG: hypothetical protein A2Z98_14045 [Spirochaetes bacterium GWB1_27_13]OHD21407.1 MAG: hypothetical protein A2Y34_16475 [Spirochaetes bacterium GWC1_27_15]